MPLLFVYGTLKRGERANRLLSGQRFVGAAETEPRYRLVDLGRYPGLIADPDAGVCVRGELWDVSECCVAELDDYEGCPDLFTRGPVALRDGTESVEAYFFARPVPATARTGAVWPFDPPGAVPRRD